MLTINEHRKQKVALKHFKARDWYDI